MDNQAFQYQRRVIEQHAAQGSGNKKALVEAVLLLADIVNSGFEKLTAPKVNIGNYEGDIIHDFGKEKV